VDLETPRNDGITPACIATYTNSLECLKFLADRGVNLETPRNNGDTPAYAAAENNNLKCLTFLADQNIDLMTLNKEGVSPYDIATKKGHSDCAKFLQLRTILKKYRGCKRICANCGVKKDSQKDLKTCGSCRFPSYCNRSCQRMHWKIHKHECVSRM